MAASACFHVMRVRTFLLTRIEWPLVPAEKTLECPKGGNDEWRIKVECIKAWDDLWASPAFAWLRRVLGKADARSVAAPKLGGLDARRLRIRLR